MKFNKSQALRMMLMFLIAALVFFVISSIVSSRRWPNLGYCPEGSDCYAGGYALTLIYLAVAMAYMLSSMGYAIGGVLHPIRLIHALCIGGGVAIVPGLILGAISLLGSNQMDETFYQGTFAGCLAAGAFVTLALMWNAGKGEELQPEAGPGDCYDRVSTAGEDFSQRPGARLIVLNLFWGAGLTVLLLVSMSAILLFFPIVIFSFLVFVFSPAAHWRILERMNAGRHHENVQYVIAMPLTIFLIPLLIVFLLYAL
ncbi:MAG: hypothetical protein ACYC6O_06175 [Thermoleophilia bacterium]